jgi:hypothetical protein
MTTDAGPASGRALKVNEGTDWNDRLLAEHRAHLRTEDGRQAFDALVSLGTRLKNYDPAAAPGQSKMLA